MTTRFATTRELIDGLGGTRAVAQLCGVSINAVGNWRTSNVLPAHSFAKISVELLRRDLKADVNLWRWERRKKSPPANENALPAG